MKKEKVLLIIALVLQTIIYICVGELKSYIHIDEAYSYGLTNYDKVEIVDNVDFYNEWHTKEYYEDYLSIQEDEVGDLKPIYENQKNDVHPPLYYLLLRFAMSFTKEHFSKWAGIALNIIIYLFITVFMYLILKNLFKDEKNASTKAVILAFISSITLASISNVIYIRMYALLTLLIVITTYLHIKLLFTKALNIKLLIANGIVILFGILTHYYYLLYLVALYLIFFVKYIRQKNFKMLAYYTLSYVISGTVSLLIFPYSIGHMFFGYRGEGVLTSLKNISQIIPSLLAQLRNLNYYAFNGFLLLFIILIIVLFIYNKLHKNNKKTIDTNIKEILEIIFIPSMFFLIITSIASPWKVLRYMVPVCGLIFVIAVFYLYKYLQKTCKKLNVDVIMIVIYVVILLAPFVFKLEPELLYYDQKEIMNNIEEHADLPAIYLYYSNNGNFLSDILAFSVIDNSYIAKDVPVTEDTIKDIVQNQNISKGILVFTNKNEEVELIINSIMEYLNFSNYECWQKLTSCVVYYIY